MRKSKRQRIVEEQQKFLDRIMQKHMGALSVDYARQCMGLPTFEHIEAFCKEHHLVCMLSMQSRQKNTAGVPRVYTVLDRV